MAGIECPKDDVLLAFCRGDLSEEVEDAIADHIDACSNCEARLAELERQAANMPGQDVIPGGGAYMKEAAFQKAAKRVQNIGGQSSDASMLNQTVDLKRGDTSAAGVGQTIDSKQSAVGDAASLLSGATLFGDYELIKEIARGGMGVVYRARQTSLNRIVALKMILAGQFAGEQEIERFRAEAEAAANLDHPGIVPVYEVGEHDGRHYFSMGFIDGVSLASKIKDGPLPPRDFAELTKQVADAVAYAHEHGVIHRDLKPANVLIDNKGRPRVTDFGLAKQIEADSGLTATGQVLGTPSYMPPEQATGTTEITPAADVYSLGAILYALLTGRPPFQAASTVDTVRQVLEQDPVPWQLNGSVSRDLETICMKCMEKRPEQRYATADALTSDLECWLNYKPISARRPNAVERGFKWVRRKPAVAGLLFASMLALLFLGGVAVATWDNKRLQEALTTTSRARQIEEQARLAETEARSDAEQAAEREAIARVAAETAGKELRRTDYLRRIALARLEWQGGRTSRVDNLLNGCPPEWQGWEWHFLRNLNHQELASIGQASETLAFSHDGKRLYTGKKRADDPASPLIEIRDPETGTLVRSFGNQPNTQVWQIISSADDSSLIVMSEERVEPNNQVEPIGRRRIERWNASTGDVEQIYYESDPARLNSKRPHVAISPDNGSIAAALRDPGLVVIWDSTTGDERRSLQHPETDAEPTSIAFSPDGELLAAGFSSGDIIVWNAADGELVQQLKPDLEFNPGVYFLAFDPTGKRLAMTFGRLLQVWNTSDWSTTARVESDSTNQRFAFDSSGKTLAVIGIRTTIDVRETETGRLLAELHGHSEFPYSVAFTPSGSLVSVETFGGRMKFWNPARHSSESFVIRCDNSVASLDFSPDGTRLAVGGGTAKDGEDGDFVSVHDVTSGTELFNGKNHNNAVRSVAFAPDGNSIVTASWDRRVGLWDLQKGGKAELLNDEVEIGAESVAVSPSGRWFASAGGSRKSIRIWDRNKREIVRKLELTNPNDSGEAPTGIGFSPDGRWFASAFLRTGIRVWSTENWELQRTFGKPARCLAFSRDSAYVANGHSGGSITMWNVATGESVRTFLRHKTLVTDVSFNEDDSRLATSSVDGTVKIWDTATGQELLTLTGHAGVVSAIAFSPNGQLLATGGRDGTVRIYDGTPRN